MSGRMQEIQERWHNSPGAVLRADIVYLLDAAAALRERAERAEAEAREIVELIHAALPFADDSVVGAARDLARSREEWRDCARREDAKVKAINNFLNDFGTLGQNDQAIWEYLNHGTPLPVKEESNG